MIKKKLSNAISSTDSVVHNPKRQYVVLYTCDLLTRSEIDDHVRVFSRNVDVEFADDILIVAVPYQTVDVMRAVEITVVPVDNSGVANRMSLSRHTSKT